MTPINDRQDTSTTSSQGRCYHDVAPAEITVREYGVGVLRRAETRPPMHVLEI